MQSSSTSLPAGWHDALQYIETHESLTSAADPLRAVMCKRILQM